MANAVLEENYRKYLQTLSLTNLRIIGRDNGVPQSSALSKAQLISDIVDVLVGNKLPVPRSKKGAPVKGNFIDPSILRKLSDIRRDAEDGSGGVFELSESEKLSEIYGDSVNTGILEIMPSGIGFLRAPDLQTFGSEDVCVLAPNLRHLGLRQGDMVSCKVKLRERDQTKVLDELLLVNQMPYGEYDKRPAFESLQPCYPQEKIRFAEGQDRALWLIDLFAPIGKGQRALIAASDKAGKSALLRKMANVLVENKSVHPIYLLLDECPEEVTEIRQEFRGSEIISSTFDEKPEHHVRVAELAMARAKRLAESGKDVVILMDSLTKLTRAYNLVAENTGRFLAEGLDAGAFIAPKRIFGSARKLDEAGSVTILATVGVEDDGMDDVIFQQFRDTANAVLYLQDNPAERRIMPQLDIRKSGTRKDELLLSEEEWATASGARRAYDAELADNMLETLCSAENYEGFLNSFHALLDGASRKKDN